VNTLFRTGTAAHFSALLVLVIACTWPGSAQAQEPAGVVLMTRGTVTAIDVTGNSRPLKRRDTVFTGDTLVTGTGSAVQVRLVDDAQYSLNASSRFTFTTYSYDGNESTPDSAQMHLLQGCFRSISGHIGDQDHDEFRIDTLAGWIGINGTVHSGCFDGKVLSTATREGGTTVTNEYGSVSTGIKAAYDYSETVVGKAPTGVLNEPAAIANFDQDPGQPNISFSGALGPNPVQRPTTILPNNTPLIKPQQDYDIIQ
jgi:hypothetical protein